MVKYQDEIVRNMKQRVRTPQFLNRVIKVYDFTTLFSRLMMYRRAKSSLVQPKKEGEEETTYNMYNSMFIRIKKKNKFNDKKMARILKRFYNISPTSTVEVMYTCMEYLISFNFGWFFFEMEFLTLVIGLFWFIRLVHHLRLDILLFNLSQSIWSTSGYSCSFGINDIATNLCI